MRKFALSTGVVLFMYAFMPITAQAGEAPTLISALVGGKASLNGRLFYFNRDFDAPGVSNIEALAVGGIAKYETARFGDVQFGLAYYGSHSLDLMIDRDRGRGSALLQRDGDDIALLGEAYLDYQPGAHQFRLGRQRLATPLMNDHDLRMLPASYQAAVYRNRHWPGSLIEAGYVERYSGFASALGRFDRHVARWGDAGLAYVYGETKLGAAGVRGQYVTALEDRGQFNGYHYIDANLPLSVGEKSSITAQLGGTDYRQGSSATMFGLRAGTTVGRFDFSALYNQVRGNAYRTVQSGIMYTDLQQGYANYEPSHAFGAQANYRINDAASLRIAYVDVISQDIQRYTVDDFKETNLDFNYRFNKATALRLRYSIKDQDRRSTREDRDDFRVILYFNF